MTRIRLGKALGKALGPGADPFEKPMERGTVLSMQGNTFAMTGVKHCIRPADLVGGESVSLLLRRIHPELLREADALRQQDNES